MTGKDLFIGLNYIDRKFIEEAENGTLPRSRSLTVVKTEGKTGKRPQILLVAAIAALMLLLMGCAAAVLLNLDSLRVGEESYVENAHYLEDGTKVPAAEKVKDIICVAGPEGSKNQMAMQEWYEFTQSYDQTYSSDFQKPAEYISYSANSQEMVDRINAICEKYGLKLMGKAALALHYDTDILAEVLGIDGILKDDAQAQEEFSGGRFYESGNFGLDYYVSLLDLEAEWADRILVSYTYSCRDVFSTTYIAIEDPEAAEQWNYTLADGTEVLIVSADGMGHILCDREDAFLCVSFEAVSENGNGREEVMSRRDMELIAEALDYTLKPKQVENMAQVQARLEASAEAYQNRDDSQLMEEARKLYEENECFDNYADLIACMRDNEEYFTSRKNAAYEDFWNTVEYVLMDVTGDGNDELILGKEGTVTGIWTIRDGVTNQVTGSGYLCEGNVFESYAFVDGKPYHWYYQFTEEGTREAILSVEYDSYEETWKMDKSDSVSPPEPISEEDAMAIIDSFVRLELDMKPVSEFPMN